MVTAAVAAGCSGNASISCGVISYTPTQIIYEGDLDGSGTVYRVYVQLQAGAGETCPCILQRGAIRKVDALAGNTPTYFTEHSSRTADTQSPASSNQQDLCEHDPDSGLLR